MRAFLLAAFVLAACAQPGGGADPASPPPHQQLSPLAQRILADNARLDAELSGEGVAAAGIGETADLGGGLTIRPLALIEDSRCAADVVCVWAGRLRLRALVAGETRELTLGEPLATPAGVVVLATAKPGAWSEWPESELGARPPYRFGFRRG